MWQPATPSFPAFCNAFAFIAMSFEKYIIAALRQAKDRLACGSCNPACAGLHVGRKRSGVID
jgi:hypothetical protein